MERAKELPDKDSSVESGVSEASDASVCAPLSQKIETIIWTYPFNICSEA